MAVERQISSRAGGAQGERLTLELLLEKMERSCLVFYCCCNMFEEIMAANLQSSKKAYRSRKLSELPIG